MPRPDRALRRLVVDLVSLHPDDKEAVLAELVPSQRKSVEDLLREFSQFGFGQETVASEPKIGTKLFSPWLAARLKGTHDSVTPTTREALRNAARRITPNAGDASSAPRDGRGWFARRSL